jgi:rhodanese-related sulfurtransferase
MTKTSAKNPQAAPAREVKTITKQDLYARMQKGGAVQVVNVLAPEGYALGVIKGSLKIPLAELSRRSAELDKSKDIVTYCAGPTCDASRKAAELLAAKGFTVSAYEGGAQEWKESGLPLEPETGREVGS